MRAIEFVKKFGLGDAREYLDGAGFWRTDLTPIIVNMDDLKQIVDAWELVEKVGRLDNAKTFDDGCMYCIDHLTTLGNLKQAIKLVERCNA